MSPPPCNKMSPSHGGGDMRRWHFITWWRMYMRRWHLLMYMVEDVHEKMTSSHVHGGGCTWEDDIFSCTWWRMYMRRWHLYYMAEETWEGDILLHGGGCTWEDDIFSCTLWRMYMRRWHLLITWWRMYMRRWHLLMYIVEDVHEKVTSSHVHGGGCTWEGDILLHGGGGMGRWHFITWWRRHEKMTSSHVHGGGCTREDDILLHGGGDM